MNGGFSAESFIQDPARFAEDAVIAEAIVDRSFTHHRKSLGKETNPIVKNSQRTNRG